MNDTWEYQGEPVLFPPEDAYGFIYLITNLTNNKIYVGKKNFAGKRKVKLLRKEKRLPQFKGKTHKIQVLPSSWKNYWGSCVPLKEDINLIGKDNFKREIIRYCNDSLNLHYWETYFQMKLNVLRCNSYNGCIAGKYFRGKIHS